MIFLLETLSEFNDIFIERLGESMLTYNYLGDDTLAVQLLAYKASYTHNFSKYVDSVIDFYKLDGKKSC